MYVNLEEFKKKYRRSASTLAPIMKLFFMSYAMNFDVNILIYQDHNEGLLHSKIYPHKNVLRVKDRLN